MLLCLPGLLLAQDDTDIYLFDNIKFENYGVRLGNRVQITDAVGYDNQPTFSSDGSFIFYTAIRDGKQADIYRYSLETKTTVQVTNTSESEYSPTPLPGGTHLSVVKVEKDGTQRIWKVPILGKKKKQEVLVPKVDSVGYHCWINPETLVVFVLGKKPTLRKVDVATQTETVLAHNIARGMQKVPGKNAVYFTQKIKGKLHLMHCDLASNAIDTLAPMPLETQDLLVMNTGKLYCADQGSVFEFDPAHPGDWTIVDSFPETRFFGPSRMAASPDGRKYAVVFVESDAPD